jgi:hypothetical protein
MLEPLPNRAFFGFELPVHYLAKVPPVDGTLTGFERRHLAPSLVELEGGEPIADVWWGWREEGFFAAFDVPNRGARPKCDTKHWYKHDGLRLCIDTRDARDLKRATRFCHFFYILPLGGGSDGKRPVVGLHRMSRAKEPTPEVDVAKIKVAAHVERSGYVVEVGIPAACLHGWNPAEHPRIGLFYKVKDNRLGDQHLTVDDELGWNTDPSTWATGVLVSDSGR